MTILTLVLRALVQEHGCGEKVHLAVHADHLIEMGNGGTLEGSHIGNLPFFSTVRTIIWYLESPAIFTALTIEKSELYSA